MQKIGLALGGGGAKGLAHVAILEVLDEFGIRPHCIAGTSIGAIVGVLYASGHLGSEIRREVERVSLRGGEGLGELFNRRGELLLQQRAGDKRLWPGYWSNSCCSHPRRGEDMREAVERRLHQELALHCALKFLYKFEYRARYEDVGSEHELCWVFAGRSDGPVEANRREIAAWRFVAPDVLEAEMATHPERFTPWFKLEWPRVRALFLPRAERSDTQVVQGAFS